jgi:uncharacterized protein YdeI (YjbR/CyaY-like superfamily)
MRARSFPDPEAFRTWLRTNHASVSELIVRCYKTKDAHRGITYRQALDEALCFGWIDGVRHALDACSFTVRFTPRKAKSGWSQVNLKRAFELEAAGRMRAPDSPRSESAPYRRTPTRPGRRSSTELS